jgi:hypothetical protein
MAIIDVYPTPVFTPSHAVYLWDQMLSAAGWTIGGNGDGLSAHHATNNVFTGTTPWSTGANCMGNAKALRPTAGARSYG